MTTTLKSSRDDGVGQQSFDRIAAARGQFSRIRQVAPVADLEGPSRRRTDAVTVFLISDNTVKHALQKRKFLDPPLGANVRPI